MALDENAIRRIMREERENERREAEAAAREKARDDRLAELERKVTEKGKGKEDDGEEHEFTE